MARLGLFPLGNIQYGSIRRTFCRNGVLNTSGYSLLQEIRSLNGSRVASHMAPVRALSAVYGLNRKVMFLRIL